MLNKVALFSFSLSFLLMMACPLAGALADDEKPNLSEDKLTGNWSGTRDRLFDKGVSFDIYYKADAWRNFSGGAAKGNRTLDNLDIKISVDGDKALDMNGTTFLVYLLNNNGGKPNAIAATNGGIDNIETPGHAFKLYEAWVQKNWRNDTISLLVGLHDLNSEFYVTDTSGLFLNPTYGIGTEMAATGDNGPSIFPATSLAARLELHPRDGVYLKGGIFDGVPGDTNDFKGTHIRLKDKEGALVVAEGGVNNDNLGHFGVGGWEYSARRPDQVAAALMRHSRGVYFLADKSVYKIGDKNIDAFGRLGFTAGDVEQFSSSWSVGVVLSGFVPERKDAQVGFAIASNNNSDKFKTANAPVDSSETQVELTYKDMLTPWLSLQPDLQYTLNPGTDPVLKNTWMGGIRMGVDF